MTPADETREALWGRLEGPWDVVVVGGGITGAGILHEAARRGLSALLVERGDFASGTSSRSSKLVHGGLRYLAQGDLRMTWESVRERDRLLAEAPGLVDPIGFLLAAYRGQKPGLAAYGTGLFIYDRLGHGAAHRPLSAKDLLMLAPRLAGEKLLGGFWYRDAQTDDARLVLRVLAEAFDAGASALNHVSVVELLVSGNSASGVVVRDILTERVKRVSAKVVVNATGAWADRLRAAVGARPAIRPLRGSHLLFSPWRFPVAQAVTFRHPRDGRPLFAYPWEGLTLLGTTDLDHTTGLDEEPSITGVEASYLVEAARAAFPGLDLTASAAVSSFAGVRPVIGTGKADPSKESREHVIWDEGGLVTVTGGKLTTFRRLARDTVHALRHRLPRLKEMKEGTPGRRAAFAPPPALAPRPDLAEADARRLAGRHGRHAEKLVAAAREGELERIPGSLSLWAELRWAARTERVERLDDLLLRRVRLGLVLPEGGHEHFGRIRSICQPELGWNNERWDMEEERYLDVWRHGHAAHLSHG